MGSSGQLGQDLSEAVGLALESRAIVILQTLRLNEMISKKGRGVSAAGMTYDDAATMLIAFASDGSMRQIPGLTRGLRGLKLLARVRAEDMLPASLPEETITFGRVLAKLIEDGKNHDNATVEIGTDIGKTSGYAFVSSDINGTRWHRIFGSWKLGPDLSRLDALSIFPNASACLNSVRFDGRVLAVLKHSVDTPMSTTRKRFKPWDEQADSSDQEEDHQNTAMPRP